VDIERSVFSGTIGLYAGGRMDEISESGELRCFSSQISPSSSSLKLLTVMEISISRIDI
jgi:hypothetical protein